MTAAHAQPPATGGSRATEQSTRRLLPDVPANLIFAWGNPSRGDDAIGPWLKDRLETYDLSDTELLTDFQLQIEHITDLAHRTRVVFIDASVSATPPFDFRQIGPEEDRSYTTHAMSPQALLAVYRRVNGADPPPCFLLTVRGYDFRLGQPLSAPAMRHADQALQFLLGHIATGLDRDATNKTP
jgi:hydrogenase maturation protease